mmetsp:Transcript_18391/g.23664  ORF Transcript_18391/g.23664 Transcript_18391/m.23664 type:complete len:184 (+) Transcript_18391:130-681(+)|eukprot:CAMPEP_0198137728 /NCGR_PEP_ID=MMETSP1443-20131203/1193_1 /TAXON_ID=186043 /ORGANISM="Entomoneis sp., Strain CCMP2396" /LENGTH=183 /DNA_ID=CAMNT_0043799255 /DNA_START=98 /DNA_END=652 /DNA_ORIENTATION=+
MLATSQYSRFIQGVVLLILGTIPSSAGFVTPGNHHHGRQHQLQLRHQQKHVSSLFMSADGTYDDFTPRDDWKAMSQEERKEVIETRRLGAGTDAEIYKGTVKWFDTKKGFGFITRDNDGSDFFVHQSALKADGFRSLDDGASVEFQIEVDGGRERAVSVTSPEGAQLKRGYAYKKVVASDDSA